MVPNNEVKMQAARILAQQKWPYLAAILFNLKFVEVEGNNPSTMGVDQGWRLYWNRDFVSGLQVNELATVLVHECLHCMFEHHQRFSRLTATTKNAEAWNISGDCAINQLLLDSGFVFPKLSPPVTFDSYADLLDPALNTEQNYFRLLKGGWTSDPNNSHDCGSAVGGGPRNYELTADDSNAPAISDVGKTIAKSQVQTAIKEGVSFGAEAPEELRRFVEELEKPKVSWKRELASLMRPSIGTTIGRKDYSMMRLGRREGSFRSKSFSPRFPAMRQPLPPKITVILDTSPSMDRDWLRAGLSEVIGIVRAVGAGQKVTVIPCSGKAYEPQQVKRASKVMHLELPGDQSTDLRNGFFRAMEESKKPKIIVVVTDGYTPWPDTKPKGVHRVIILLTDESAIDDVPKWAKAILLPTYSDISDTTP